MTNLDKLLSDVSFILSGYKTHHITLINDHKASLADLKELILAIISESCIVSISTDGIVLSINTK